MTLKAKYFVDLSELISIQFECKKCHAIALRRFDAQDMNLPATCGNCKEPWTGADSTDKRFLDEMVTAVRGIRRMQEQSKFTVSFETGTLNQ